MGESDPQEFELRMMVEPPNKIKNKKSPSSSENEEEVEKRLPEGWTSEERKETVRNVWERISITKSSKVDAENSKGGQTPENLLG